MIKCVFFDFDGVLRNWEYDWATIGDLYGISLDAFREVAFAPENVVPAVRGEITDEEWRANVGRILKTRFPGRDVEGALEFWSGRTGELAIEVLEIVRECKSKLPVALMTNATSKLNQDLESLGIADLFDHVINASEIGSIKPEPEIYLHALKIARIDPHEAFFTDDMPENVEAAERLGYVGHVFETAEGLRSALVKAGVLQ
ncbi:MAG: HAD-IA family hydrolase [Chloroflexi bacterium]|nr:HAD-IA family hydrolase [Chloroflexota bacterium]